MCIMWTRGGDSLVHDLHLPLSDRSQRVNAFPKSFKIKMEAMCYQVVSNIAQFYIQI